MTRTPGIIAIGVLHSPMHQHAAKCILFAMRCLCQLNDFIEQPSEAECIVGEMIDWLKVRDPALIKEIFWNPDNFLARCLG